MEDITGDLAQFEVETVSWARSDPIRVATLENASGEICRIPNNTLSKPQAIIK